MKETVINNLKTSADIKIKIAEELSEIIVTATEIITDTYKHGGKLFLIGNGGSAADAQHIAAELIGKLPALALTTDTSILTALANDYGYGTVFSRQLETLSNEGDVLIAISTGGTSQNIIKAVEVAKKKKVKVIGLTGKSGGMLKNMADIAIIVPSESIPRIQEAHITIGHIICDLVEKNLFK